MTSATAQSGTTDSQQSTPTADTAATNTTPTAVQTNAASQTPTLRAPFSQTSQRR